jgi:hypothetical protein
MTARGIPPSIATLAADLGWSADDFGNARRNSANAVGPSAAWHATAGSPIAAVLAAQQEFTRRSYDGAARIARDMAAPLDAAVGDALAAGIPREQMWIEYDTESGDRSERRLMTGPQGQDTPPQQRRQLARVWIEHLADRIEVRSWSAGRHHDRPSLLPDRPLTPAERSAHDEDPRQGVWVKDQGADLRKLTQDQTDSLIRRELWQEASSRGEDDMGEIEASLGKPRAVDLGVRIASCQRGGIDSDPMVRLLAYRAWGDRDRQWFELRGVRKGEAITVTGREMLARARYRDTPCGHALEDGRPGDNLPIVTADGYTTYGRVSDRRRVYPAQPRALTPDEAGLWSLRRIDEAASYFATVGILREHMWVENDGTTQTLWGGPSGKQSAPDLRQALARAWLDISDMEMRYEGPEVEPEYDTIQQPIRANHVSARLRDEPDPQPPPFVPPFAR